MTNLTYVVLQGYILVPVRFLVYINDISNLISLRLLSFVDDTTVYHSKCVQTKVECKKDRFCISIPKYGNYEVKSTVKINNEVINKIVKNNSEETVKYL